MAPAISDELLSLVRSTWRRLGGYLQAQNGGRYLKLMHPRFSVDRACVVVDLDRDGRFQHFTNVRITTLVEWHRVFREVAQAFEPYWPPDRGWQSNSRDNRIECEVRQVPDWRELVQRYLELCRDHWVSGR